MNRFPGYVWLFFFRSLLIVHFADEMSWDHRIHKQLLIKYSVQLYVNGLREHQRSSAYDTRVGAEGGSDHRYAFIGTFEPVVVQVAFSCFEKEFSSLRESPADDDEVG